MQPNQSINYSSPGAATLLFPLPVVAAKAKKKCCKKYKKGKRCKKCPKR